MKTATYSCLAGLLVLAILLAPVPGGLFPVSIEGMAVEVAILRLRVLKLTPWFQYEDEIALSDLRGVKIKLANRDGDASYEYEHFYGPGVR